MSNRLILVLLFFAPLLEMSAQGRVVMMNTWADASSSSDDESGANRAADREAAYYQALNDIDSLQSVILQLKRELKEVNREKEALLNYNRELVQSDLQETREQRKQAQVAAVDEEAIKEAITYEDCMEATSFQPLFSEIIKVEYTLNKNNNSFTGQLIHTYTPEIGQREMRTQEITGVYERTRDQLQLHIEEIDLVPTDVTFSVHDKSYKSFVKAGPEAAALPYTKVVNFEELMLGYCLF